MPTYYYDQFSVSKVQAGQFTMLAAFIGAVLPVFGGWISDHWGGINTLTVVLVTVAATLTLGGLVPSAMGLSKQHAGSYAWGFILFAALALLIAADCC